MNPEDSFLPRIPIGQWVSDAIDWLIANVSWLFDLIQTVFTWLVDKLTDVLLAPLPIVMVIILVAIAWLVRSWRLAVGSAVFFLLIISMEQWETTMQTMALVLVSTIIAVVIAVPLGILSARGRKFSAVMHPILDFMQTMPAFVYLIPTVMMFSIGVVPGVVATIIFSFPPGVRMTELGIRQVDAEVVEAADSFGASPWQVLRGVQLPLAIPTIMAGVNQVIMLALSMAVIAGMIGADGLGKEVVEAISTLDLGQGVEAGLAVVLLAVYLDRITAALGNPREYNSSIIALVSRARATRATTGI